MKNKILTLILVSFFMISFVSAYDTHKQNTDLEYSFTSNNATGCNLTKATTPTGLLEIDQEATKSGNTFNVSISGENITTTGDYCFNLVCTDGISKETGSFCRTVTPNGEEISQGISMIYLILLFFDILFLAFFVILSIRIPWGNEKEIERGELVIKKVTITKYFKMICIWISSGLFIWFITTLTGLVHNFITFEPLVDMTRGLYLFVDKLGFFTTIIILMMIFINIWRDLIFNNQIRKLGMAVIDPKR